MTPNQFLLWVKGFRDSMGDALPTETQWATFNEALNDALANEVRGKLLGRGGGKITIGAIGDYLYPPDPFAGLVAYQDKNVCKIDTAL